MQPRAAWAPAHLPACRTQLLLTLLGAACQVAEARKAVSASMTAEGMRQQNEALRWALRASSSMGTCGPGFLEAGDESTLFTSSDESGARSACTAGGTLLSTGTCHTQSSTLRCTACSPPLSLGWHLCWSVRQQVSACHVLGCLADLDLAL